MLLMVLFRGGLALALALVILLIRGQPDDGLRGLLLPDDCAAPCFLTLRPHQTPVDGGFQQLQANAGIASLEYISKIVYRADFAAPLPVPQTTTVYLWENAGIIERIDLIDSGLSLGEAMLALGVPERVMLYQTIQFSVAYVARYPSGLEIYGDIPACKLDSSLWRQATSVKISFGRFHDYHRLYPDYYSVPLVFDGADWARAVRRLPVCP